MNSRTFHRRSRRPIAFTLLELLLVIAIIAVMAAAGVPAIRNIVYTSTASLAESQLRLALTATRDLAIRTSSGDTAAVFTFEPGGRLTIVPAVYVGTVLDAKDPGQLYTAGVSQVLVYRDVFVPTPLVEPVQLPQNWMVRGFAPPGSIFSSRNTSTRDVNGNAIISNGWYDENFNSGKFGNRNFNTDRDPLIGNLKNRGNWVFPETGFFDPTKGEEGDYRQTFMIRFQSGTGRIVGASRDPAVVVLPRNEVKDINALPQLPSGTAPWTAFDWRRVDRADNLVGWARSILRLPAPEAAAILGARSTDVASVNTVSIVALYDEQRLAESIGAAGVNRVTGCLYGISTVGSNGANAGSNASEVPKAPNIDVSLWSSTSSVRGGSFWGTVSDQAERVQVLINAAMIGGLRQRDVTSASLPITVRDVPIPTDVRVFSVGNYLGVPQEAKP